MRDEYDKFQKRNAEILALGPNSPSAFEKFWKDENIPFIGLPDPDHGIASLYRQEVNIFKLGRMPLNCVVDAKGYVRFAHFGASMRDIPTNDELFQVIDELNRSSN